MDALFGFFLGTIVTWPAIVAIVVLGILFEHNDSRGWAVFLALIAMVVSFFYFQLSLTTLALVSAGYLVAGLIWSFYRYKRHAMTVVAKHATSTPTEKTYALERLHPKNMLSTITAWILIWPFSLIENVLGDVLNTVQLLVTKFFRGVYYRIYDSAVSALK